MKKKVPNPTTGVSGQKYTQSASHWRFRAEIYTELQPLAFQGRNIHRASATGVSGHKCTQNFRQIKS